MKNLKYISLLVSVLFGCISHSHIAGADNSKPKLDVVVIDPGHGGKDPGCTSSDRKTLEKNVTLSIAKQLGNMISEAYPDVKVVYTRTTDKYVTLNDRAGIANANHADLFISIHVNSFGKSSPRGFSTHVLGQSSDKNRDLFSFNMEVCRRENSVILLEEDYSTKYQGFNPNDPESFIFFNLMQNAFYEQSLIFASDVDSELKKGPVGYSRGVSQDPFYVLWKTTMPAVLVEVGFMSNPTDLKILRSETGRSQIAGNLFKAFKSFKAKYDGSLDYDVESQEGKTAADAVNTGLQDGHEVMYGTQVFVLGRLLDKNDRIFKGYVPVILESGKSYKYIIGVSASEDEARKLNGSITRDFKGSYLVKIENGAASPYRQ